MDDKKPMPGPHAGTHSADQAGSQGQAGDLARDDPDAREKYNGREGGGDSAGGAYPNPHTGKKPEKDGFMGHGGQTEMPYHGKGQLGEDVIEGNENSPATKD
ncbi:MAG TPA: hypothetical protein VGD10_01725 [Allosphingosinicella sp.]|uniref:hypothetical protein n=1 Tax=Allosphingosinicella sp. TaxID=2823234 RepID=UPI002EDB8257